MSIYDVPIPEIRFPDNYDLGTPIITLKEPISTKKEAQSILGKESEEKLFCYKCNKHVKPIKKQGESILYFDFEALPIIDELSYCPICDEEVYDRDYELLVIMYKLTLLNKRRKLYEVL